MGVSWLCTTHGGGHFPHLNGPHRAVRGTNTAAYEMLSARQSLRKCCYVTNKDAFNLSESEGTMTGIRTPQDGWGFGGYWPSGSFSHLLLRERVFKELMPRHTHRHNGTSQRPEPGHLHFNKRPDQAVLIISQVWEPPIQNPLLPQRDALISRRAQNSP